MQDMIDDGLAIILACLLIAGLASALIVVRPWRRRLRHRRRHSHRTKIDLFAVEAGEPAAKTDA
ncbi:MAG TPA: hypothetical protein VGB57_00205 [Allosphingosinicella sp.]|jgi:hypothetical protein